MKKSLMAVVALCVLAGSVAAHAQAPPQEKYIASTQSIANEQEIGNISTSNSSGNAAGGLKFGLVTEQPRLASTYRIGIDPQSMHKTFLNYNTGLGTPMHTVVIEASGGAPPGTIVASF